MKLTAEQLNDIAACGDRVNVSNKDRGPPIAQRGGARVEFHAALPDGGAVLSLLDETLGAPDTWRDAACASWAEAVEAARACLATGRTCAYGPGIGLHAMLPQSAQSPVHESWETIAHAVDGAGDSTDPLNLDADYQRPRAWTEAQQSAFVGWAMTGGEVPVVYCRRIAWDQPTEVVDGKQRIIAIHAFVRGKIPATFTHNGRERTVWWRDLDEIDRRSMSLDLRVSYNNWTRKQALDFYIRLNSAGTPHAPEEIDRVRRLLFAEQE
jgi:hypothetical protein